MLLRGCELCRGDEPWLWAPNRRCLVRGRAQAAQAVLETRRRAPPAADLSSGGWRTALKASSRWGGCPCGALQGRRHAPRGAALRGGRAGRPCKTLELGHAQSPGLGGAALLCLESTTPSCCCNCCRPAYALSRRPCRPSVLPPTPDSTPPTHTHTHTQQRTPPYHPPRFALPAGDDEQPARQRLPADPAGPGADPAAGGAAGKRSHARVLGAAQLPPAAREHVPLPLSGAVSCWLVAAAGCATALCSQSVSGPGCTQPARLPACTEESRHHAWPCAALAPLAGPGCAAGGRRQPLAGMGRQVHRQVSSRCCAGCARSTCRLHAVYMPSLHAVTAAPAAHCLALCP